MSKESKDTSKVVIESFIDLKEDPCFGKLWDPETVECSQCGDFKECKKAMTSLTKEIDLNDQLPKTTGTKGTIVWSKVKSYMISKGSVVKGRELINHFVAIHGDENQVKKVIRNFLKSKKLRYHKATKTFELLKE